MSLCRIAQLDFEFGWGRYDGALELYDNDDLRDLIQFAEDHLSEGTMTEPLYGYDLAAFRDWCKQQLHKERLS